MYLSRLMLNKQASTRSLANLLDPKDQNQRADVNHRLIWTLFGDHANRDRDFLWRAHDRGQFLVLSERSPVGNDLFLTPEVKKFEPQLAVGDRLQFVLRVNATKDRAAIGRLSKGEQGRQHRRVDVVMDSLHALPPEARPAQREELTMQAAKSWMANQAKLRGFAIDELVVDAYQTIKISRGKTRATLGVLDLSGRIRVETPHDLLAALARGFGRGKAWGCGLMLIRRA